MTKKKTKTNNKNKTPEKKSTPKIDEEEKEKNEKIWWKRQGKLCVCEFKEYFFWLNVDLSAQHK